MTRFKKILLGILAAGALFAAASLVHADSPNFWLLSSNYLKPLTSTWGLQLPSLTSQNCLGTDSSGHVQAGTCGSGSSSSTAIHVGPNTATSTSFTFASTTAASGLSTTLYSSGNTITWGTTLQAGYSIPLTASSTNWNNWYNTSVLGSQGQFLGNSANGTPGWFTPYTVTVGAVGSGANYSNADVGVAINAAYAALPTSTPGTILVMNGSYTFSTPVTFTTADKPLLLNCEAGTKLNYTGSGTAMTFDTSTSSSPNFVSGYGMDGCQLYGPSGTGSTIGVAIGGSNNSEGITIQNNKIKSFGKLV